MSHRSDADRDGLVARYSNVQQTFVVQRSVWRTYARHSVEILHTTWWIFSEYLARRGATKFHENTRILRCRFIAFRIRTVKCLSKRKNSFLHAYSEESNSRFCEWSTIIFDHWKTGEHTSPSATPFSVSFPSRHEYLCPYTYIHNVHLSYWLFSLAFTN